MDEGLIGLIIFIATTVLVAICYYIKMRDFKLYVFATLLTAPVIFLFINYLKEGHFPPFGLVGMITGALYACAIAVVLYPFLYFGSTMINRNKMSEGVDKP